MPSRTDRIGSPSETSFQIAVHLLASTFGDSCHRSEGTSRRDLSQFRTAYLGHDCSLCPRPSQNPEVLCPLYSSGFQPKTPIIKGNEGGLA